jgi:hypothetical protein
MNMLRVGITEEAGKEAGITESDREMLNSLAMGITAIAAGIGDISVDPADKRWGQTITVDMAVDRFTIVLRLHGDMFTTEEANQRMQAMLTSKEFVTKMAEAKWTCNVSNESDEEFRFKTQKRLWNDMVSDHKLSTLKKDYASYDEEQSRTQSVRHLIWGILERQEDVIEHSDIIDTWGNYFGYSKPLYNDLYLHWSEDTYEFSLEDKPQEEE